MFKLEEISPFNRSASYEKAFFMPIISICIPAYNCASFIIQTIESVLSQKFDDFEIVISDDASKDSTPEMIKRFDDTRIRYYRNDRNIGMKENWNQCIRLSAGRYVKILQDDDILLKDALTVPAEILDRDFSVGMVVCARGFIDKDGKMLGKKFPFPRRGRYSGNDLIAESLIRLNPIGSPSFVMVRRECFEKVGWFDSSDYPSAELDMWCRILNFWDLYYIDEVLTLSRINPFGHTVRLVSSGEDVEYPFNDLKRILSKKEIRQNLNQLEVRSAFGLLGILCWKRFFGYLITGRFKKCWRPLKAAAVNRSLIFNCIFFFLWTVTHWSRIKCDLFSDHSLSLAQKLNSK